MNRIDAPKLDNKQIFPYDIKDMCRDEEVIVSRIQINTKLIEVEASASLDIAKLISLRKALGDIKRLDKENRGAAVGAKMRIGDILDVFGDTTNMPYNSFERI